MKKLILLPLLLICSVLTAQIDTTVQIDVSLNVSRSAVEKTFGEYIKEYRINNDLSYITLSAWFSVIATNVMEREVVFNEDDIKRMERNEFLPFIEVQKIILLLID